MMRFAFSTLFLLTGIAVAEPTPRDIKGTELLVQAELDELEAPVADVAYVPNARLAAAFPTHLFVGARFPESSAADLPKPLQLSNIYAVGSDGIPRLLATPEDVLELFKSAAQPAKSADDVKKAIEAALALESAKYPNQPFSPPQDVQVKPDGQGGFTGSGTCQPTASPTGAPSGSGPISVTMNAGKSGQPTSLKMVNNYRPPARRNRPATAADIAADMPAAQRAAGGPVTNINSPTINKMLPGQSFFTAPGKGNKKSNPAIVAVDPSGQPQVMPKYGALFHYVHKNSDKPTTAEEIRKMLTTFLTLATNMFPNHKFDPVKESDITITPNGDGGFQYKAMVYVTGDRKKWFGASGRIKPKGAIGGHAFHDKTLAE